MQLVSLTYPKLGLTQIGVRRYLSSRLIKFFVDNLRFHPQFESMNINLYFLATLKDAKKNTRHQFKTLVTELRVLVQSAKYNCLLSYAASGLTFNEQFNVSFASKNILQNMHMAFFLQKYPFCF